MNEDPRPDETPDAEPGLFQKYPKLSIILIAVVAYGLLLAMCVVVGVLLIRG